MQPAPLQPAPVAAVPETRPAPNPIDAAVHPAGLLQADADGIAEPNTALPPLGLTNAIETSLVQNPDLLTVRGQVNVSRAVGRVTRVYPWNPFIQSQYFPNGKPFVPSTGGPATAGGLSNYYVWVMQRFEMAHQRRFRAQIAAATVTQVQWNVQNAELLNVAQTMRLYFAALYQLELRDLALATAQLNARLLGVVERRFKANLNTPADVTTAKVAARQSRRQADLAEATYQAAMLALHQQLNVPLDQRLTLAARLTDITWQSVQSIDAEAGNQGHGLRALAAELVEARPDVMAASAGIRVANANAGLARAARMPDIQAGPIYETADDGTQYLGMRLQTDVPVWNNGAALANQRRAELQQQQLTHGQLRQRAMLEAQAAIDRYERARGLVEKAAADAAPVAGGIPAELQEITAQFEAGQAEILAVFVTQGNLLQDRRAYLDLLNEVAQAAAGVVQATALPPDRLATPRTAETVATPPATP